ncbi:MAG: hypothetical protein HY864_05385 [Chloroflexi bacterium]|nr:hypothetical protein [Chloroflexota bacterium]
MTELPTQSKFEILKRSLTAAFLSALATGIPMSIGYFLESQPVNLLLSIFLKSFSTPGIILLKLFLHLLIPSDIPLTTILLSLLFWFFFGFGLSLIIKNNKQAILWWLLLVLAPSTMITLLINAMAGAFQ